MQLKTAKRDVGDGEGETPKTPSKKRKLQEHTSIKSKSNIILSPSLKFTTPTHRRWVLIIARETRNDSYV